MRPIGSPVPHTAAGAPFLVGHAAVESLRPQGQHCVWHRGSMPLAGRLVEFHPSLIGEQAKENVFSMSMIQFWKFTKDTKLPDHNLTLAAIDRIFLRLKQGQGSIPLPRCHPLAPCPPRTRT